MTAKDLYRTVAQITRGSEFDFDRSPGSPAAHSVRTYESEFPIHLGGIDAQVLHFDSAHTDGDSVVYFPNLRVVAVGDLLSQNPSPDFTAGGSYVGWASALDRVLALDFDVVAPGTGPLATRADLEAFKGRMEALVSGATRLVRMGVTADEFAQRLADDNGAGFKLSRDQSAHLLAELSSSRQSTAH
jgi:glyoxylase-like metal-dependent hydrolase (beta-lactamase superfamily II)